MIVTNLKALLIVVILAAAVFHLAQPLCLRYMRPEDFKLRRQVWFALTALAFLTPNFWLFVLIAGSLMVWAARRDSNPIALFILTVSAVPPVTLPIPTVGIGALFDMNHARLLALTVLLPLAMSGSNQGKTDRANVLKAMDYPIIGFVVLQFSLLLPYDSITNILRHQLHNVLDYLLVYYVFSRYLTTKTVIYEAIAALVLACAIFSPIAFFESLRTWLLYQGIGAVWGAPDAFAWLFRGSSLRAQASLGHSLSLGFYMAIGFGFALFLSRPFQSRSKTLILGCWMWVGLIAAYSRAPWLTAILFVIFTALLSPQPSIGSKQLIGIGLAFSLVLLTPYGEKIIDSLPFVGTVDNQNVLYRQQLAETSWKLIWKNPFFGDPLVLRDMEHLRQGQGIIDLVNAYAVVALFNGLVGFVLFFSPFVVALACAYVQMRKSRQSDTANAALGATLISAMLATLFFIGTAGYSGWGLFGILGLMAAYINTGIVSRGMATVVHR